MRKQKVKIDSYDGEEVIFKTENGFKFPVPMNFLFGLSKEKGYEKETYIDFIRKQMMKVQVYMPVALV
jgi:hypothetical protein